MEMIKRLSLYKIRDLALNSGIYVYNVQQFSNLINRDKNISRVYMNRMVHNGLAIKLFNGRISFIDDDFIIASQMIFPSYISMNSALLFHNMTEQVARYVECITTINSMNYYDLGIIYHKIKPRLFFGYKRYAKNGSYIFVADPEKAVFDGLYYGIFSMDDVREFKEKIDFSGLIGNLSMLHDKRISGIVGALS